MWYLINMLKPDECHGFLCDNEYVFDREDCDIVLSGDPTVSRCHVTIQLAHCEANLASPYKLPIIKLKDLSKFGT